jgi:hypothetical protein
MQPAKPSKLGHFPWRSVNSRMMKMNRSKKLHENGLQKMYDHSEEARSLNNQVKKSAAGD